MVEGSDPGVSVEGPTPVCSRQLNLGQTPNGNTGV